MRRPAERGRLRSCGAHGHDCIVNNASADANGFVDVHNAYDGLCVQQSYDAYMFLALSTSEPASPLVVTASFSAPLHRDQIDVDARCFGQGPEVARIGGEDVVTVGS